SRAVARAAAEASWGLSYNTNRIANSNRIACECVASGGWTARFSLFRQAAKVFSRFFEPRPGLVETLIRNPGPDRLLGAVQTLERERAIEVGLRCLRIQLDGAISGIERARPLLCAPRPCGPGEKCRQIVLNARIAAVRLRGLA